MSMKFLDKSTYGSCFHWTMHFLVYVFTCSLCIGTTHIVFHLISFQRNRILHCLSIPWSSHVNAFSLMFPDDSKSSPSVIQRMKFLFLCKTIQSNNLRIGRLVWHWSLPILTCHLIHHRMQPLCRLAFLEMSDSLFLENVVRDVY